MAADGRDLRNRCIARKRSAFAPIRTTLISGPHARSAQETPAMACVPSYEAPGTLMRVSPKDPGFERFRPRRSHPRGRCSGPVDGARNNFDMARKSRSCGHFDVASTPGIASERPYCIRRLSSERHEDAKPSDKIRVCAA